MMWFLLIIAAIVAIPLVIEAFRKPMNEEARAKAPGKFASLSKGMVHFQWTGPENGPVAVCIHGLTTPSFVWQSTAKGLADMGFRVLTYDHYGRGYSDRPSGAQDRAFFLSQLQELLDAQHIDDDITVVGYSMGGAIATAFAAQDPQGIRHVILLAPAGMKSLSSSLMGRFIRLPVVGMWMILGLYPEILRKGLRKEANNPTSVPGINTLQGKELDYRGFLPAVRKSLIGILSEDLEADHKALKAAEVPVLAIWGEDDDVIPISCKDRLATWNDEAKHHIVKGAGHGVTYSHTEEVLDQIRSFTQPGNQTV